MKGVEEQLRAAVHARGDRSVARRRPVCRRAEEGLALLRVRAEWMVGHRDANSIGWGREIVAGVEQPVSALLPGDERALDQMALPIEIVAQHNRVFADDGAAIGREALAADRRG